MPGSDDGGGPVTRSRPGYPYLKVDKQVSATESERGEAIVVVVGGDEDK